ncbi:DUF4118 domain-containing protein [Nonomuraea sp. CA-141351]|uniref:DUF4118 domain-containing protein n=1 Tax=Nonomuraea sp. CA-141351 TaxID=3239996 RepID=UPI003D8FCF7E
MLLPWRDALPNTSVSLVLVVIVVAVAAMGNRPAGALAAILLLIVGLAVSQLAARARQLKVIAITDADHLARIRDTATLAQNAKEPNVVVDRVTAQLTDLLHLRGCRFEYGTLIGHPPRLDQDGTVTWGRKRWNVDRRGLPDTEVELRTFGNGRFLGRFMLDPTPGAKPSLQARLVAVTLADQAGAAIDTAGTGRP